jgi:hypothetical protein
VLKVGLSGETSATQWSDRRRRARNGGQRSEEKQGGAYGRMLFFASLSEGPIESVLAVGQLLVLI